MKRKRLIIIILICALALGGILGGVIFRGGRPGTPTGDTVAPTISGISVSNITTSTATVIWTTDEPATSQVEYGKTADYGSATSLAEQLATNHSVGLSGLEPDTAYHFRVKSKDSANNIAISGDYTFTTAKSVEALAVVSHSSYVDAWGILHIVGEVENVGPMNIEQNKVTATLYNAKGEAIGESFCFSYLSILCPGQKSPFEIILLAPPGELSSYQLETSWEATSYQPYPGVQIQSHLSYFGEEGAYWVEGVVQNTGDMAVDLVLIVGTFYDGTGTVVATCIYSAEIAPLYPSHLSLFTLAVEPERAPLIENYTLQIEAYVS